MLWNKLSYLWDENMLHMLIFLSFFTVWQSHFIFVVKYTLMWLLMLEFVKSLVSFWMAVTSATCTIQYGTDPTYMWIYQTLTHPLVPKCQQFHSVQHSRLTTLYCYCIVSCAWASKHHISTETVVIAFPTPIVNISGNHKLLYLLK